MSAHFISFLKSTTPKNNIFCKSIFDLYFSVGSNEIMSRDFKDQKISKANCGVRNSSKKQTEFDLRTHRLNVFGFLFVFSDKLLSIFSDL